jgi:peptidoglycan/xylan/chitin deacetylase (PgdA/CDA1 family)
MLGENRSRHFIDKCIEMAKILILHIARLLGLFALSRRITRNYLRILCYHGIWQGPEPHYGDYLFMSAKRFAQRMALLKKQGYQAITLADACLRLKNGTIGPRDIVITVDDGWASTYQHMLPVLKRHAFPATIYITTYYASAQKPVLNVMIGYLVSRAKCRPDFSRIFADHHFDTSSDDQLIKQLSKLVDELPDLNNRCAEVEHIGAILCVDVNELQTHNTFMLMSPKDINQAYNSGFDIQLHTHTHRIHNFNPDRLKDEINLNRSHLSETIGCEPTGFTHFCYPSGQYHPMMFDLLREAGIESATTTEFGLNPPHSNPYALKRILDCESFTNIEFLARLSGFWSVAHSIKSAMPALGK